MFGSEGGMFMGGGFMWLFWLLLIVALVVLVKAISGGAASDGSTSETPMDILKKRYARGEIDDQEFERKRRELES